MAWNEPGNGQRDPWNRQRPSGGGKFNADALLKRLRERLGKLGGGPGGLLTVVVAFVLAWIAFSSFTIVDARQAGVVLRFGQYARTLGPGFHFKLPQPIESVTKVDTTRIRSVADKVRMLTRDENIITIDFNVQYQVADARKYLFAINNPDGTVNDAAEAAVRAVVGGSDMDQVLSGEGASLVAQSRDVLQQTLDSYDAGLVVSEVSFQNVAPPQEVKDAFDDVNNAREDKQSIENNAQAYASKVVPVARGEAARIAAEAQGYKAERVARAQGDAERFTLLLKEYKAAPEVTRRRLWLETVEQVLADNPKVLDAGDGRNIINLPSERVSGQRKDLPGVGAALAAPPTSGDAGEKQP